MWLAVWAPWFNIPRDQADSAGMLAHLHAYFVDGDLLYDNEYARLGMSPLFAFVTEEGVVSNHWPAGATWLQLPGYALGITAARALQWLEIGRASPLGVVAVLGVRAWASVVGLVIGWVVAARLRQIPSVTVAGAALGAAVMFVGTPLLYYVAEAPLRPHLWGAACVLAFVVVWSRPELGRDRPHQRAAVLGLLVGLAAMVRPQLAPLGLLALADAWPRPGRARALAIVVGCAALFGLVHVRTQLWMYGAGVTDYAGAVTTHVRHFLFSPYHGALSWCPVLALGFAAVVRSAWRRERGGIIIAVLLVHQIVLDASMRPIEAESVLGTRTWAGGTGFAARKLVDVVPLMLPAVLSLVAAATAAGRGRALAVLATVAAVPTVLLHVAAFVSPEATTGTIIDSMTALGRTMSTAWSGDAWRQATQARALPWTVPAVVSAVVTLPLMLAAKRVGRGLTGAGATGLRGVMIALLVAGGVAHLWLSVLQVRSDAVLIDDPQRMIRAAQTMTPRHRALVAQIAAHHRQLRARLGDDAAP